MDISSEQPNAEIEPALEQPPEHPPEHPPEQPRGQTAAEAARVRLVTEQARCLGCGYDLRGLSVFHEPHYGWYVTKCSECGTVNPMNGFGRDRKAAKALSINAAATWVIAGLVFAVAWGAGNFGIGMMTTMMLFHAEGLQFSITDVVGALFHVLWAVPQMFVGALVFTALMPRRDKLRLLIIVVAVMGFPAFLWAMPIWDAYNGWQSRREQFIKQTWVWLVPLLIVIQTWMIVAADVAARWTLRKVLEVVGPRGVVLGLAELWTSHGRPLPRRVTDPDG